VKRKLRGIYHSLIAPAITNTLLIERRRQLIRGFAVKVQSIVKFRRVGDQVRLVADDATALGGTVLSITFR
jgi:hypothetical protein